MLRAHLLEEHLSPSTVDGYLCDARLFLVFLSGHSIPLRTTQPSDVESFLSQQRRQYRRRRGHLPPDDIAWRCERTPGIHRLLALAQGHWPPATEVDRRAAWFRKKLLKEKLDSESARKYECGVKQFLAFLHRIALPPERATHEDVSAFLKDHLKSYRRTHKRAPSDIRGWKRGYLTPIHRFLRFVQGQWPPPPRPDLELDEYRQHLISRAINRKTIFDYCLHVRIFLDYVRACGTSVGDVKPNDVEAFHRVGLRMYRKRKPNRVNSIAWWRTVSRKSVRSFLRFRLGEWPPDKTPAVVVRFRQHLKDLRYGAKVIERNLWAVRRFVTYLGEHGIAIEVVQPADVEAFLAIQKEQYLSHHRRAPRYEARWRSQFKAPAYSLMRMINPEWPPPAPPRNAQERFQRGVCDGYAQWLVDVRGLSVATLRKDGDAARVFLRWLHENAGIKSLRRLSVKDIDAYLAWRLPGLRRATRMGVCGSLRSFLRYLHSAKRIARDLAPAVSSPSLYQFEDIPRAFTEAQIEAVLETARRDRRPVGLRDYAMLLMLATYGLRSGEVLRLRLEDIEWREERLRVRQSKTGIESFLPLMQAVGEALVGYLRDGRPQTERREVFLSVRAPFGPLAGPGSFATIILRRLRESGIEVKGRHGAHAFRFARALSLLRASVSEKWIGDLLGHRSASSTQTYLRLATEDLRALSLEVPGKR